MSKIFGELERASLEQVAALPTGANAFRARKIFLTTADTSTSPTSLPGEYTHDGTSWVKTGSGSAGAGLINYVTNPDAETGVTGWAAYADAAATSPVDGTGGSPNSTITQNTSSPLRGTADFKLTKNTGASRQGEGCSYDFTISAADQAKILRISFDYKTADVSGTTLVDGDVRVFVYDVTNSQLIEPVGRDLYVNSNGKYIGEFQANSNSTSYRLIFHIAQAVSSSEWTLNFDNVQVGPREIARGSVINDWQSYTPTTQGFGTVSSMSAWWRRSGDSIQVRAKFTTGTVAASEAQFGLPTGLSIDSTKVPSTRSLVGHASDDIASTTIFGLGVLATGGDTFVNFGLQSSTLSIIGNERLGTEVAGNTTVFSLNFSAPITGWSSNANISSDFGGRDISVRAVKTSGSHITSGSELDVTWDTTESYDTTSSFVPSTGIFTAPETGKYLLTCNLTFAASATGVRYLAVVKNTSVVAYGPVFPGSASYGGGVSVSTEIDLIAGDTLKVTGFQNSGGSLAYSTTAGANALTISKRANPQTLIGSEVVAASYYASANNGSSSTQSANFDTKIFDTHTAVTAAAAGTGTWKFTAPYSKMYRVTGMIFLTTGATPNLVVYKGGVAYATISSIPTQGAFTYLIQLNAGEYIDVRLSSSLTCAGGAITSSPSSIQIEGVN